MPSTDDLRFLLAVANTKSLAAAARFLDVTPSAVTQRLKGLETRLGARLVERSGQRIALTDEGELVVTRGRQILDDISDITETLAQRRAEVSGKLRIMAPLGFGRRYVAPLAAEFQANYPAVSVDLILTTSPIHAPSPVVDLMIYIGEMRDSSSLMQHLADHERVVCCSPSYVERYGLPETPQDLRNHDCIALRQQEETDATLWRFQRRGGSRDHESVRIQPKLSSNDGDVVKGWACSGRGIIIRSEWDVSEDIRSGRLVRLLSNYRLPPADIVALIGTDRRARTARTRMFLDLLKKNLTPPPWNPASKRRGRQWARRKS